MITHFYSISNYFLCMIIIYLKIIFLDWQFENLEWGVGNMILTKKKILLHNSIIWSGWIGSVWQVYDTWFICVIVPFIKEIFKNSNQLTRWLKTCSVIIRSVCYGWLSSPHWTRHTGITALTNFKMYIFKYICKEIWRKNVFNFFLITFWFCNSLYLKIYKIIQEIA